MKISKRKINIRLAELGLTKVELCRSCGMMPNNLARIMRRGSCEPKTIGRLAQALNVPVEELLEEVQQ